VGILLEHQNKSRDVYPCNHVVRSGDVKSLVFSRPYIAQMNMENDFKSNAQACIVDFELDLFNKHARYVHHYTGLRFQGDAAIQRYFGQETFVTDAATL